MKRSREDEPALSAPDIDSPYSTLQEDQPISTDTDEPLDFSKIPYLENESGEESTTAMRCSLPPHRDTLSFNSLEDYEVHYRKDHTNRCLECRKNFPTAHFLDLHILENHDSLVSIKKERGDKTFSCFVEDCERVCSTPQKRRMHLIDKHHFPKDYDFQLVDQGVDSRTSMLRSGRHRRRSSAAQHKYETRENARRKNALSQSQNGVLKNGVEENGEKGTVAAQLGGEKSAGESLEPKPEDDVMEDLTGAMSSLKFVPSSIRFGRRSGQGRGGFSRT